MTDAGPMAAGRVRSFVTRLVLNGIVIYCLFGMMYCGFFRVLDWPPRPRLFAHLPALIFPFQSWPMFKFLLRSEYAVRVEGLRPNGSWQTIPNRDIFAYRALDGRTVVDHQITALILRSEFSSRHCRATLARAILRSPAVARQGYTAVSAFVDYRDVTTGTTFASVPVVRIQLGLRPGAAFPPIVPGLVSR